MVSKRVSPVENFGFHQSFILAFYAEFSQRGKPINCYISGNFGDAVFNLKNACFLAEFLNETLL